jgi:hypothetical protein
MSIHTRPGGVERRCLPSNPTIPIVFGNVGDPVASGIVARLDLQMVVNLKTTKALGLTVPQSILLRADEVIQ